MRFAARDGADLAEIADNVFSDFECAFPLQFPTYGEQQVGRGTLIQRKIGSASDRLPEPFEGTKVRVEEDLIELRRAEMGVVHALSGDVNYQLPEALLTPRDVERVMNVGHVDGLSQHYI